MDPHSAIVTTLKNPGKTLESWLHYHLSLGFDRIFLFFDDPTDESKELCNQFNQTQIEILSVTDYTQYAHLPSYPSISPFLKSEVQARQHLNSEIALHKCFSLNINWLLHIDIDELFYCTRDLKQHFLSLEANNIGTLTYANYEVVPEQTDIEDYFASCTLFRKHLSQVPLSGPAATALNYWKEKTNHGQYFLAYDIGKSVTRVVPGVTPINVHSWRLPPESLLLARTAITDIRALDLKNIYQVDDAFILHYVSCGYQWWKEKYRILDNFPNHWFAGKLKIQPSFHLDSRDIYLKGDEAERKRFYSVDREQVVTSDPIQISEQIKSGLCLRLTKPQEIILSRFPHKKQANTEKMESVPEKAVTAPKPKPEQSGNVSLDQMWIISSLVGQYMTDK